MTDDTLRAALNMVLGRVLSLPEMVGEPNAGGRSLVRRTEVVEALDAALATQPAGVDELRAAAVAMCNLWFTENAVDGSPHLRKAMLDLREAVARAYAEDQP